MSRFRQSEVPTVLLDALRRARRVLVQGHVRPDGDAVAATLGLGLGLERMGKDVHICLTDGVPERFTFLPESHRVSRDPEAKGPYELVVLLDTASAVRAGYPHMERRLAPLVVNIDHHPTNEDFADLNWVDASSSSTAEMVHHLLGDLGVKVDRDLGTVLMNGIATDTGFFKYASASPRTLRVAAELMEAGVDHSDLHRQLFEDTPLGVQQLKGRALSRIVREAGDRILWTWLHRDDGEECRVGGALASIGVTPLTPVQGAELVACFEGRGDGTTIVEFRSRGEIAVDALALSLGGGGHAKASGCTVPHDLEGARELVLPKLRALLDEVEARRAA